MSRLQPRVLPRHQVSDVTRIRSRLSSLLIRLELMGSQSEDSLRIPPSSEREIEVWTSCDTDDLRMRQLPDKQ